MVKNLTYVCLIVYSNSKPFFSPVVVIFSFDLSVPIPLVIVVLIILDSADVVPATAIGVYFIVLGITLPLGCTPSEDSENISTPLFVGLILVYLISTYDV